MIIITFTKSHTIIFPSFFFFYNLLGEKARKEKEKKREKRE